MNLFLISIEPICIASRAPAVLHASMSSALYPSRPNRDIHDPGKDSKEGRYTHMPPCHAPSPRILSACTLVIRTRFSVSARLADNWASCEWRCVCFFRQLHTSPSPSPIWNENTHKLPRLDRAARARRDGRPRRVHVETPCGSHLVFVLRLSLSGVLALMVVWWHRQVVVLLKASVSKPFTTVKTTSSSVSPISRSDVVRFIHTSSPLRRMKPTQTKQCKSGGGVKHHTSPSPYHQLTSKRQIHRVNIAFRVPRLLKSIEELLTSVGMSSCRGCRLNRLS